MHKYFGKGLADKGVHVLDPFTGTGTFITRTLQYLQQKMDAGQITFDDILYKYMHELHANEIVLLSYYIAAINIESVFDELNGPDREHKPFNGIVLTDTFESTERKDSFMDELLGQNNERLKKQQEQPITAIISNPPYSIDNNNDSYSILDNHISNTYGYDIKGRNKKLLFDSYIRAFRWATDRIGSNGIIAFVSNGSFIDSSIASGFRRSLNDDFNHLYIFNLRGNQRTSGETSRKEGGKIFGSGSRTPIAISVLVKDNSDKHEINYYDIGDYLSRKNKLDILKSYSSIIKIDFIKIHPDLNNDWINKRDFKYEKYVPIFDQKGNGIFINKNPGIKTHRDEWVYNFGINSLTVNIKKFIKNFNSEIDRLKYKNNKYDLINKNPSFLKWSDGLKKLLTRNKKIKSFDNAFLRVGMYRPFVKKYLYFNSEIIEMDRNFDNKLNDDSKVLYISRDNKKMFSALIIRGIPNVHLISSGQGFLRNDNSLKNSIFGNSNINDSLSKDYGLSDDDMFSYVYAILHNKYYLCKYENDLKKELPRIPLVKNKMKYVEIGKKLMDLHLNYEEVQKYEDVDIENDSNNYVVNKMKFSKVRDENGKLVKDKSTIIFNDDITISNIPPKAYEYVVNGKSAIEWIMDQYQVKTDKKSGITDDPNEYSDDPKYIFNLLLRIINVSVQTVDLVNQLPKFEVDE